jgi:hypothetical protein
VAVFSTTGPQLSELPAAHPGLKVSIPCWSPDTPEWSGALAQKQQIAGRYAANDPFTAPRLTRIAICQGWHAVTKQARRQPWSVFGQGSRADEVARYFIELGVGVLGVAT